MGIKRGPLLELQFDLRRRSSALISVLHAPVDGHAKPRLKPLNPPTQCAGVFARCTTLVCVRSSVPIDKMRELGLEHWKKPVSHAVIEPQRSRMDNLGAGIAGCREELLQVGPVIRDPWENRCDDQPGVDPCLTEPVERAQPYRWAG